MIRSFLYLKVVKKDWADQLIRKIAALSIANAHNEKHIYFFKMIKLIQAYSKVFCIHGQLYTRTNMLLTVFLTCLSGRKLFKLLE